MCFMLANEKKNYKKKIANFSLSIFSIKKKTDNLEKMKMSAFTLYKKKRKSFEMSFCGDLLEYGRELSLPGLNHKFTSYFQILVWLKVRTKFLIIKIGN